MVLSQRGSRRAFPLFQREGELPSHLPALTPSNPSISPAHPPEGVRPEQKQTVFWGIGGGKWGIQAFLEAFSPWWREPNGFVCASGRGLAGGSECAQTALEAADEGPWRECMNMYGSDPIRGRMTNIV
jgi:hypothetical protein